MKKKLWIFFPAMLLTVVLFSLSTTLQRKLIQYEPKTKILFLKEDIMANEKLNEEQFFEGEIAISLVANLKVVRNFSEIQDLYAKDNILKGQIALFQQFDTKENLSIYEVEQEKEKISIKIKTPENGVSYAIKPNSLVNVYVTLRSDLSESLFKDAEKLSIGSLEYGYEIIPLLKNQKVIECFDIEGKRISESETGIIDTVIIAVTHEEAKQINLLREIATFNMTGVS